MAVEWLVLTFGICVAGVWWWARSPYHHRSVRWDEFADFVNNLVRDADGSKMIVEDEATHRSVVVEKLYSDESSQIFALRTDVRDRPVTALGRVAQTEGINHSLRHEDGQVELTVRCHHRADVSHVTRALHAMFEWLSSTTSGTYHIYFDAKAEALQARFERVLADPGVSGFRREVAARALKVLDKKLERNNSGRAADTKSQVH